MLAGGATIALAACKHDPPLTLPTPPDLAPIVSSYEAPAGTFDSATAKSIEAWLAANLKALVDLGLQDQVLKAVVDPVRAAASADGGTRTASVGIESALEGRGTIEVDRVCNGWIEPPVADGANGSLALNANFHDEGIDGVVWGTARACKYKLAGKRLMIGGRTDGTTGTVSLYLGKERVRLDELGRLPMVLVIDGAATIDDVRVELRVDLRFVPDQKSFELRVPTPAGDVIAETSGDTLLRVRAKNGTFDCDMRARQCRSATGDVVRF